MSAAESRPVDRAASLPKPSPENRVYLRDLPTPTELVPEIEDYARRHGGWFRRAKERRYAENSLKLRYYFGGHLVAYLRTPDGYAIVALDSLGECMYESLRNVLSTEELAQLHMTVVVPWPMTEEWIISGPR